MNNNICINGNLFFIAVIGIFLLINYVKDNRSCPTMQCPNITIPENNNNKLDSYRYDKIYDPLTAPTKKYVGPFNFKFPNFLKSYSTRGPLPQYQYIGNLVGNHNEKDIILQLYGRPTYHGSNQWEHYSLHPHENIKYSIDYEKELRTNDTINIREFSDTSFTFYENDNDSDLFRYNPYNIY